MTPLASILILAVGGPRVSEVVVYPDRAQVTRAATVACDGRAVTARFEAIPPSADASTFRARTSAGTVEGLRSEERTRAEAYAPEVKDLDEQIRKLEGEQRALNDAVARASQSSSVAGGYTDVAVALVSREMNDPAPNVKGWGAALDAALAARQRAGQETVDDQAKLRELGWKLDDLRRKRARLTTASARREWLAEVLVACPAGKQAEVELTYLVGGASWAPSYEARADEAGGAVELSTFATVRQATGESWSNARVVLSTAVPRQDATPPEIQPLRLWAEERKPEKKVIVRRDEMNEHADATGATATTTPAPSSGRPLRAQSQGLSVQLVVPDPADVAGDGKPARLFVGTTRMKAKFALRAVPKMAPFAFRVADFANQAPYPLLPGPLDAFRKGGLIARYPLERTAEGAPMHLTFGIEDSVRVKRIVVEEIQRDKNFLGLTRRFRFAYKFELANYLGRDGEIEVSEHIPVSELDDVRVAVDPTTTDGFEARKDDGILVWRVRLRNGEKRVVQLAFHVDVPSSYDSGAM